MTTRTTSIWKRIFCGLAACTVMAAASGCSSGDDASTAGDSSSASSAASSADASSEETSSAPAATSTSEAIGFEANVYPFPDEPYMQYPLEQGGTVSMWIPFSSVSSKYYQSLAEDITVKQFEEDTGVTVEFVHPAQGQESENFNLLVVSDSLPDIIVNGATYYAGGDAAAVEDGVFADLTDLVAENAPDYNYFLEVNDLFWRLATSNDGSVYSLYCYKDIQAPYYERTQLRKDWLDEWGMEIPTTFAEYEEYFQKVQETYPDVSPFTLDKSGLEVEFLASFDAATVDNGQRFFVVDGKIHHTFSEPGLLDYLTMMNDWYNKGYINPDFTTVDNADQEFANGRTAMVVGNSDTIFTLAQELDFEPTTAPYPRVNEGDLYHGDIFYFPQNGTPTNISAKSENKELALQFLNYGFTKQGSGVANFGDPDTSWTWGTEINPDYGMTIPEYTDYALNNPDYPMSDIEYTVRLHVMWSKYRYGDDVSMIRNVADPACWEYRAMWGDDETSDNSRALPGLTFSPEVADEVGSLTTDINTYAEEMCLRFITGATPLSEFESFTQEVEALGMPRLLELYQQAYDNLLSKQR